MSAHRSQNMASDPLELRLQAVLSRELNSGLLKKQWVLLPESIFPVPQSLKQPHEVDKQPIRSRHHCYCF